jgi:radical SAM/Cys-rich protein
MEAKIQKPDVEAEWGGAPESFESFPGTLSAHGLELTREETKTLQINVGFLCNQTCRHCHLEAGPARRKVMNRETVDEVISYAKRAPFSVIDITGGAPEMNPHLSRLIEGVAPETPRIMLRSNLTALTEDGAKGSLIDLCRASNVVIVASLPALNASQVDAQRGKGVMDNSIATLKRLNDLGYGREAGLELNLVANPTGAFMPVSQEQAEARFKRELLRKWGIVFNHLYTFANVPLGRYRRWLIETGNYEQYMHRLVSGFNPCTIEGLMCRTLVSVAWDGTLYDCDFNLAKGLFMGGRRVHVSRMDGPPEPGTHIAVADHCYACTAGSGFT